METTFTNCTPHPVNVYDKASAERTLLHSFPAVQTARLTQEPQANLGTLKTLSGHDVPVVSAQKFTGVEGLPEDKKANIIVSMVVGNYMSQNGVEWEGRVVGPDTGKGAVRDEKGQIIGTTQFIEYCRAQILS